MTTSKTKAKAKFEKARKAIQPAVKLLLDLNAQCMEQSGDTDVGIVCERWLLPNGKSVIVYGTPIYVDVFVVLTTGGPTWSDVGDGLRVLAGVTP